MGKENKCIDSQDVRLRSGNFVIQCLFVFQDAMLRKSAQGTGMSASNVKIKLHNYGSFNKAGKL